MRSAPPAERLLKLGLDPRLPLPGMRLLAPGEAVRLPVPAPPRLLAKAPPCRLMDWRAFACRFANESPRVVPPNLSAVARSRYGAPPRCSGLCCQLLRPPPAGRVEARFPPPTLPRFPPPRLGNCDGRFPPKFVLRLKLLLLLIVMLLPPQPQPQPQPPLQNAPIITPKPKEIAAVAA